MLLKGRELVKAVVQSWLDSDVDQSPHPDINLYCSLCLCLRVKTKTAMASQVTFLKIFSLRYFLSYPRFPTKSGQSLNIHTQEEITHCALSLVL